MRNRKPSAHSVTPLSASLPESLKECVCVYVHTCSTGLCASTVWSIPKPCGSSLFWYFKTYTRVITNSNDKVMIPVLTNKSYNKITNIPLAFHRGYANNGAMPTSFESNLTATKAAVWACCVATFLGKSLKVERTNKQENSQQSLSFFYTVVLTLLNWPTLTKELHAGISTLTTLFLTSWQNKTQACTWVLTPSCRATQLENHYRAFLRLADQSATSWGVLCQKCLNYEVNSETNNWRIWPKHQRI